MKNRTTRRKQNVAESNGTSPRIVEMRDGSFTCTHPSKQQSREGDYCRLVETVRPSLTHSHALQRFAFPVCAFAGYRWRRVDPNPYDGDGRRRGLHVLSEEKIRGGKSGRQRAPQTASSYRGECHRSRLPHPSCMMSIRAHGTGNAHRVLISSESTQLQR